MKRLTARHAASIASLSSTAMAPLYGLWDAFAALSLLLARKPAVTSRSAALQARRSAPRMRRAANFFALRWMTAVVATLSPGTRLRGTVSACGRVLVKAPFSSSPPKKLLPTVRALVVQRASLPRAQSHAARRANLSINLSLKMSVSILAAQRLLLWTSRLKPSIVWKCRQTTVLALAALMIALKPYIPGTILQKFVAEEP